MKEKIEINTHYKGVLCKAQIGRNTLSHLKYYRGTNQFDDIITIHHIINARSMNIVPMIDAIITNDTGKYKMFTKIKNINN